MQVSVHGNSFDGIPVVQLVLKVKILLADLFKKIPHKFESNLFHLSTWMIL